MPSRWVGVKGFEWHCESYFDYMASEENSSQPLPAAQTPPRRKRGARFWITLAGGALAAAPVVLYIAAWGYINLGFMKGSIERRISRKFGTVTRVGSIQGDALK